MRRHGQRGWGMCLLLACLWVAGLSGCKTIHEELQPIRETTLTVARSGGEVSLSWMGVKGMYYSVMYTDARGAKARWNVLPDATNVRALVSGDPIVVKDRVGAGQQRYYRLVQDSKPMVP